MNSQIKKMNNFLILLKENINVLNKFFKNERYLYILIKQYNGLINNVKSIDALLQLDNVEDAFTIFRKYLETYLIMMSVLKNKNIVDLYVEHDKFIGKKVCKIDIDEVKQYCSEKPDGYLEYGYLESVIDTTREDFKYTMRDVANAAGLYYFYEKGYKISNNFVHNNLTSVNIKTKDSKQKLIDLCVKSIDEMIKEYTKIIV